MDHVKTKTLIENWWMNPGGALDVIQEYIRVPNQSPMFDEHWKTNGLLDKAADLLIQWAKSLNISNQSIRLVKEKDKTPLIFITIEPTSPSAPTVLMYGHLDKQPPMQDSWDPALGSPWDPFLTADKQKLYGRGGADDGYSIFSALLAVKALQEQGLPHDRIVVIIEACEESGSIDLPFYINLLSEDIKEPSLIVCLDSGCGTYNKFWLTTSLRGVCNGNLRVDILSEGVHSGKASGIVPSSFRIARDLLSRVEDVSTGEIKVKELYAEIPSDRKQQIENAAQVLGDTVHTQFPFVSGAVPNQGTNAELFTNGTWKPTLSVVGADGMPLPAVAGNVLRQFTTLTLSFRLPPTVDAKAAGEALKKVLEKDPPYNAKVTFNLLKAGTGWNSPSMPQWLEDIVEEGAKAAFGDSFGAMGEGGSIPFMGMLGEMFPKAQFIVTGVLGPNSNAHGPNEFLHLPQAKGVTHVISYILHQHALHYQKIE